MEKVYVVYEMIDNGEYVEPNYRLVSIHQTGEGANMKKEALDKKLSSLMKDWGYSYCIEEHMLEA